MRWDALFADLDRQWQAEERRELDAEVADRTRVERAAVGLGARLAAAGPMSLDITVCTGVRLSGVVLDVGRDWALIASGVHGTAAPYLVPFAAMTAITGLGSRASSADQARRFGLGYALRGLSRDRAVVMVDDIGGGAAVGTIDAVGADLLELAEHPGDLVRRPVNVTGRRLVPFTALALVRPA